MGIVTTLRGIRESRVTLVVVVALAMFLDDFLVTVVVPILPVIFLDECHQSDSATVNITDETWTSTTAYGQATDPLGSSDESVVGCVGAVNTRLGLLLASQSVVRIVMSLFGSYLCDKLGYQLLMLIGCSLMLVSCVVYAIAKSYSVFLIARLIHGLAAIPNDVGGLGMLAYRFSDNDEKRGFVLGLSICGFAFGTMAGPPFGGVVSIYLGQSAPFIIIAGILALLALAEIAIYERTTATDVKEDGTTIFKLLTDPLILLAAGALAIASLVFGLLQPVLPLWIISTMEAEDWQLGVVFLPLGVAYIFGSAVFGYFAYTIGRWLCIAVSLAAISISTAMIPFATSFAGLLAPMTVFGLAFGILDATSCGIINYLVEKRHHGAYGGAATLTVVTVSLGLVIGPALSSALINHIGFPWMLRGLGIITAIFTPLCLCLRQADRAPPSDDNKEDEMTLILPVHRPQTVTRRVT